MDPFDAADLQAPAVVDFRGEDEQALQWGLEGRGEAG